MSSHEREGAEEGQQGDDQVLGAVMRDLADIDQVGGQAADQVPGFLIVEEAERELLQVVEGAAAQLGLDIDAEYVAPVDDHRRQPAVQQVDGEQGGDGEKDDREVALGQQAVDEGAHRHREPEFKHAGDGGAAEIEQQQPDVRAVVGQEWPQQLQNRPARIAAATSSPASRFSLNRCRQPRGSLMSIVAACHASSAAGSARAAKEPSR